MAERESLHQFLRRLRLWANAPVRLDPDEGNGSPATMKARLVTARSACCECERPFPKPVTEEQARADWGDAADDEIGYACASCAEDFERGGDHYGR